MQKRCYCCYEVAEFESDNELLCDKCRLNGCKLTFPGTTGLSDGPTSGASQACFDRPDPLKECTMQAKKMEAAGQLNDAKSQWAVKMKLKKLKEQEPLRQKLDYQKNSGAAHPLNGVN